MHSNTRLIAARLCASWLQHYNLKLLGKGSRSKKNTAYTANHITHYTPRPKDNKYFFTATLGRILLELVPSINTAHTHTHNIVNIKLRQRLYDEFLQMPIESAPN